MTDYFDIAYNQTMQIEGYRVLTNNPDDPGKETYSGISRRYWPRWAGWKLIDEWKRTGAIDWQIIDQLTRDFYFKNFWQASRADIIAEISPAVAYELFDTAVNVSVQRASEFLQRAHNVCSRSSYDLLVDGDIGEKTIRALRGDIRNANDELILVNCMNGELYIFYKNNPKHKTFRGWFTRV